MSGKRPLLSILVLNYKGKHHLPDCLDAVFAQDFQDFELVFVDNASNDASPGWVRTHYPRATVVENTENWGFAEGNNRGLPHCRGEWIFFLNNDTRLEPGCLRLLAEAIANRKPAQQVFAPLMVRWSDPRLIDSGGDMLTIWGLSTKSEHLTVDHDRFAQSHPIALACGGAAVFSAELLERIGGFDPDFFLLFEDVDLSLRARHAGAEITLVPAARVWHRGSATIGNLSRTHVYYSGRNLFWAKIKNYPALTLLKFAPLELLTTLASFKGSIVHGTTRWWCEALRDMLRGIPHMLQKRRRILATSLISRAEFERWLGR